MGLEFGICAPWTGCHMNSSLLEFICVPFRKMPPKDVIFTHDITSYCSEL